MQKGVNFSKYEGLGNDIIVFDFSPDELGMKPEKLARFLRRTAHRQLGVGADEIAFVERLAKGSRYAARVAFYNSDGSGAETCGNGLRCVAKHLYENGGSIGRKSFSLLTGAGQNNCRIETSSSGAVRRVSVEMGRASLGRTRIGLGGKTYHIMTVSMGNPHAVIFGRFGVDLMSSIGKALQRHRLFPGGVNVDFASVKRKNIIDLVVWERGCGFTLACGSGACAAAAAAVQKSLCDHCKSIEVHLPGGLLKITVAKDYEITMSGPARRVFTGKLDSVSYLSRKL